MVVSDIPARSYHSRCDTPVWVWQRHSGPASDEEGNYPNWAPNDRIPGGGDCRPRPLTTCTVLSMDWELRITLTTYPNQKSDPFRHIVPRTVPRPPGQSPALPTGCRRGIQLYQAKASSGFAERGAFAPMAEPSLSAAGSRAAMPEVCGQKSAGDPWACFHADPRWSRQKSRCSGRTPTSGLTRLLGLRR